jgi:hypothetical protein
VDRILLVSPLVDPHASNIVSETASLTGQPWFITIGLTNEY